MAFDGMAEHADGTITFEQYVREQVGAGQVPYRGAISAYLPRRPRKEPR